MLQYIFLIILAFVFNFISLQKTEKNSIISFVGNNEYTRKKNLSIYISFIYIFFLLSLRAIFVGSDTGNYRYMFDSIRVQTFNEMLSSDAETLFLLLNWIVGQFTENFQILLTVSTLITLIPIASLYVEEREHSYLKIILFLNMTTFVMMFSGVRQSIAFAIGTIAYRFVRKKKLIAFLICVFVAMGFHHSAFILFILYPLYHITFKRKHIWIAVAVIAVVYTFNKQIFGFLVNFLARYSDEYAGIEISETGAITSLILFVLFAVLAYLIPDEAVIDKETIGLRNILLFAIFLQVFASVHVLAMRMNYYFVIFIPILIPKILRVASQRYKQVAALAEVVMNVFFTVYFIFYIYSANGTGGALNIVPYHFFWENVI